MHFIFKTQKTMRCEKYERKKYPHVGEQLLVLERQRWHKDNWTQLCLPSSANVIQRTTTADLFSTLQRCAFKKLQMQIHMLTSFYFY